MKRTTIPLATSVILLLGFQLFALMIMLLAYERIALADDANFPTAAPRPYWQATQTDDQNIQNNGTDNEEVQGSGNFSDGSNGESADTKKIWEQIAAEQQKISAARQALQKLYAMLGTGQSSTTSFGAVAPIVQSSWQAWPSNNNESEDTYQNPTDQAKILQHDPGDLRKDFRKIEKIDDLERKLHRNYRDDKRGHGKIDRIGRHDDRKDRFEKREFKTDKIDVRHNPGSRYGARQHRTTNGRNFTQHQKTSNSKFKLSRPAGNHGSSNHRLNPGYGHSHRGAHGGSGSVHHYKANGGGFNAGKHGSWNHRLNPGHGFSHRGASGSGSVRHHGGNGNGFTRSVQAADRGLAHHRPSGNGGPVHHAGPRAQQS